MIMLMHNNTFRFGVTFLLALQYSLFRTTEFSTFVKPLPIIFWLVVVLISSKRPEGRWVALSLFCAAIGDILLELGSNWLILATIPFLASTVLLAWAFHLRGHVASVKNNRIGELLLLLPLALLAFGFHRFMAPLMGDSAKIGAVLMVLSVLLLWRSLAVLIFKRNAEDKRVYRLIGFLGACGIIANYVLYAVNIGLHPVPRDVVIQLYYWGQAFAAWSFLMPSNKMTPQR